MDEYGLFVVMSIFGGISAIWIVGEICRATMVKGSKGRYFWASVVQITRFPAMFASLLYGIVAIRVDGSWLLAANSGGCFALQVWFWKTRPDDDDTFFNDLSGRLFGPRHANAHN